MNELFIRRLKADPAMNHFDCGNGSINDKIKDGYYTTLLKHGYAYEICLNDMVIGHYMFRIVPLLYDSDYKIGSEIPCYSAIKLEYLAIDQKYQRAGNGTKVLKYIIHMAKQYSEQMPIRFLSIDALTEKVEWYIECGFQMYGQDNRGSESITVPMFMDFCDMDTVMEYCQSFV